MQIKSRYNIHTQRDFLRGELMNILSVRKSDKELLSRELHELLESISTKRKMKNTLICFKKEWMQKSFI